MSMCVCNKCGAYVDSDEDPECFVEVGNMRRMNFTEIWCEACRDLDEVLREAEESRADACIAEMEKQQETHNAR